MPRSRYSGEATAKCEPTHKNSAQSLPTSWHSRLGVVSVLHAQGVDVIAETHSGREVASVAAIEQPDLVVVGQPADLSVADTVKRLSRLRPRPTVVAVLPTGQEHVVGYLVALGARGVALRAGSPEELAGVIASALKGEQHVVAGLHARSRAPCGPGRSRSNPTSC